MLNPEKKGKKVDLEFFFKNLKLNIRFDCKITISVTTNRQKKITKPVNFKITKKKKLRRNKQ